MNKMNNLIQFGFISGIIGIIAEYIGTIQVSYIILLILITLDTVTGVIKAIKYGRFNSAGFLKLFSKIILYSLSVLAVRLLEIGIESLVRTTLLSQIIVAMLVISETISILEHLALLGVPLPSNFIKKLFGDIVLPIVGRVSDNSSNIEKYFNEIDDIIKYNLQMFDRDCVRKMLSIKFDVWKKVAMQLNNSLNERECKDSDHIYYKTKVLIQNGFQEMAKRWEEENIPWECIEKFNREHQRKVDQWLRKVNHICFSEENINIKKEQLIESIVVVLYQTIIDTRKIN